MALTDFQRQICRLLAGQRIASGESDVAEAPHSTRRCRRPRILRHIDLFHDTDAALYASWTSDRVVLMEHGYAVRVLRDRPGLVEAEVLRDHNSVIIEWIRNSAFRFFPLAFSGIT